jgi:hypothetical protein
MKHTYVLLWTSIVLLLLLCIAPSFRTEGFVSQSTIPPILWTYWNSNEIPDVVKRCIDSWAYHNPSYEINVVTPANLYDYIDIDIKDIQFNDSPARESDIVRLLLLEEYGGVWSDASILATAPYPFSLDSGAEFIGYYLDGFTTRPEFPVLESWFFATVPHGQFIKGWKRAFFSLDTFVTVKDAVEYMKQVGIDLQKISNIEYLYIHVAAQYVMQTDRSVLRTMQFMKAEDGPYRYLTQNDWDSRKALENLCKGQNRTELIKFRGHERKILQEEKDLQECVLKV